MSNCRIVHLTNRLAIAPIGRAADQCTPAICWIPPTPGMSKTPRARSRGTNSGPYPAKNGRWASGDARAGFTVPAGNLAPGHS